MSILAVRAALTAVVAAVPGVNEARAYPPDTVGVMPLAYLGDALAMVTEGMSQEVCDWTLPLTLVVQRVVDYGGEMAAAEALMDDVLAAIRADYTLGGTTFGVRLTDVREGQLRIAEVPVVGMTLTFRIKTKTTVTYG